MDKKYEKIKIENATDEELFNYRKFITDQLEENEAIYNQQFH